MLFTFPSQYWFAIGLSAVFSLARWFWRIQTGSHVSRLTQDTTRYNMCFVYGTVTRYGPTFQKGSTTHTESTMWSYNPGCAETPPVWAFPFSLATTRGITTCFLFLQVLRCFSSLGLLPFQDNWSSTSWVAPFGDPRITGHYAPPRGLSQPIASFIASESQGIHRTPLVTFRSAQDLKCSTRPITRSVLVCPTTCQRTVPWMGDHPFGAGRRLEKWHCGEYRSRTDDLLLAKQAL